MKIRRWAVPALVLALAACGAPHLPQAVPLGGTPAQNDPIEPLKEGFPLDMAVYPDDNTYRVLAVDELPLVGATADSSAPGVPVSRIIDGDYATQWVNEPYRAATSWAAVQLSASTTLASISIKTGILPSGVRYDVQVSSDGSSWRTVLTSQTNTTWNAETKTFPSGTTGKYVRIFYRNSSTNPIDHFTIYELNVNGQTGTAPSPGPTPTPGPSSTPIPSPGTGTAVRVRPSGITASSSYSGLPPTRAIDGDQGTQWASGGYKTAEESLTLNFSSTVSFSQIKIKTGALPEGITYKVDVSNDGVNWTGASGRLTNRTWNLETQPLTGSGKYLKIRFFNSLTAPIARFVVYEVEAYSGGSVIATPIPTPRPSGTNSPGATPTPGGASAWYPDLIAVATQTYFVEEVDGRSKLRFSTGIANLGPGHMQLVHNLSDLKAYQEVLNGSNQIIYRQQVSNLVYYAPHGHYHIAGMARYTLRSGSPTGSIVRNSVKTSFCVEDSYKYRSTSEGSRYPDCHSTGSGLTRNYIDVYTPNLPGQDFDFTDLPRGDYYIVVEIDPDRRFLDYRRTNNVSWSKFALDGRAGTATRTGNYTP